MSTQQKVCWIMKIKEERRKEYIEIHSRGKVWPSVLDSMRKAGFSKMTIFMYELVAIIYAEVKDFNKATEYLSKNPDTVKWNKINSNMTDEAPNFSSKNYDYVLPIIFDFENGKQVN